MSYLQIYYFYILERERYLSLKFPPAKFPLNTFCVCIRTAPAKNETTTKDIVHKMEQK